MEGERGWWRPVCRDLATKYWWKTKPEGLMVKCFLDFENQTVHRRELSIPRVTSLHPENICGTRSRLSQLERTFMSHGVLFTYPCLLFLVGGFYFTASKEQIKVNLCKISLQKIKKRCSDYDACGDKIKYRVKHSFDHYEPIHFTIWDISCVFGMLHSFG